MPRRKARGPADPMLFTLLLLQAATPQLELTCGGGGVATRENVATAYGSQNSGNSAWPSAHERETNRFQDDVALRLAGDDSRIRLPEAAIPATQAGDGWFRLGKLEMTDRSITGFAAVNAMSRPKVHIDRRTGAIRISGRSLSYSGTCEMPRS